jgi:hypothetical protein
MMKIQGKRRLASGGMKVRSVVSGTLFRENGAGIIAFRYTGEGL